MLQKINILSKRKNIILILCVSVILLLLIIKSRRKLQLPEATEYLSKRNNARSAFFFVETSRSGNFSLRQACAVESTAKLHPLSDIYLFILSPPLNFNIDKNPLLHFITEKYQNIQILNLTLEIYFKNSPLEDWYNSGKLSRSKYLQSHTSDVVRYFTLWKYGGTYLDLDIVLMKSFNGLKNFAGIESENDINCALLNFEPRKSKLAYKCMMDIKNNFKGSAWGYNGPGVITRMLNKLCNTNLTQLMTKEKCHNKFNVMPRVDFYPIYYTDSTLYFDESKSNATMEIIKNSYAIHLWNHESNSKIIKVGSKQPYGLVAEKYCPLVYDSAGSVF